MLKHLSVRNYALIDSLNLEFKNGLTVLTGETGAGKSIILGALGLVLGRRADLKSLRNPDLKCVIEAVFKLEQARFGGFFEENDLDFEEDCIFRREITPGGKSRSFINDTPVTLNTLNELSSQVVDVHSQNDTLLLNNSSFQLQLLDAYANNSMQRVAYAEAFGAWKESEAAIADYEKSFSLESYDYDYQQFLFDELEQARLESGEQERLEKELHILECAGEISESLAAALNSFEDESGAGITQGLSNLISSLRKLSDFEADDPDLLSRSESVHIELQDIRQELESLSQSIDLDPSRLSAVDERRSTIVGLQKKHGVNSEEELLLRQAEIGSKLEQYANHDEKIQNLKEALSKAEAKLAQKAKDLRVSRESAVSVVEGSVQKVLHDLNMPAAKFEVRLSDTSYQASGADAIDFFFSANPGRAVMPLKKVASGGELSRVMLAVKSIMAAKSKLPAIVFDEIDTGVSGETAGKIGTILSEMSLNMQVIAITHLPQIASRGNSHLKVLKELTEGNTLTRIEILNEDSRLHELARMLSGEQITEAAMANARTLRHHN